jgi:hypothetical protein
MKYSLSNLLLFIALVAAFAGWFYDHRRLVNTTERLNSENTDLFHQLSFSRSTGSSTVTTGWPPAPPRTYDFSIENDRRDFVRDHFTKPFDISIDTASRKNHGELKLSPSYVSGRNSLNSTH